MALRGLYLISKDLFFNNNDEQSKKFIEVLEPEAQAINDIRNHLEHKFISIKKPVLALLPKDELTRGTTLIGFLPLSQGTNIPLINNADDASLNTRDFSF